MQRANSSVRVWDCAIQSFGAAGTRRRAVCEPLESRTLLSSAGKFDTTFGGDGEATFSLGNHITLVSQDVAVQSDGKVVVAGYSVDNSNGSSALRRFTVARFNANGTPDTSFGGANTGAAITTLFNANGGASASAVVIQPDGMIVAAGNAVYSGEPEFAIARYTTSGLLDTGFGPLKNGISTVSDFGDFTAYSSANDLTLQKDGKIVIVGYVYRGIVTEGIDMAVARLTTAGILDGSFGDSGVQAMDIGDDDEAHAVAMDYAGTAASNPNYGKIVVVGDSGPDDGSSRAFAIVRLTSGGDQDGSFSGDGVVISRFVSEYAYSQARAVVIQPSDQIVIAGPVGPTPKGSHNFGVVRLNSNGSGDLNFGPSNGEAEIDFGGDDAADSMVIGQTGKLIVGGSSNGRMVVACLDEGGFIDPVFATKGKLTTPFDGAAAGMALSPGGTIVASGGDGFTTARFYDRAASVHVTSSDPFASEAGQGTANFYFVRDEALPYATRVSYFVSGTASPPGSIPSSIVDYTGIPGLAFRTIFIPAGQTQSAAIVITPIDDTRAEDDENVIINVNEDPGVYDAVLPTAEVLVILDNDRQVSGTVFKDANSNGVLDAGDSGQQGWTVYADTNGNKSFDSTEPHTVTNSDGKYFLGGLGAGPVTVREVLQSGYQRTLPMPPNDSYKVSTSPPISNINFGNALVAVTGSISGTVFNDANGNGSKDSGEAGRAGITIYNDANNNSVLDPTEVRTMTDGNGNYTLGSLAAGSYKIRQVLPTGWKQTTPANGFGWTLSLTANQNLTGKSFGEQATAPSGGSGSISGAVFNDANGNGKQDSGEGGIGSVELYIDTNNDGSLDNNEVNVHTNSSGNYTFSSLAAGTYILRAIPPSNDKQTLPSNNLGQHITLTSGQKKTGVLFGEKKIA